MGIMDDANDMKNKAADKMESTEIDDKAKAKIEQMRQNRKESDESSDHQSMMS